MLNDVLVVLPVLDEKMGQGCLSTIVDGSAFGIPRCDILVVDNTRDGFSQLSAQYRDPDGHNIGVARSWNVGARQVLDSDTEYLVICSSVMRFGPELHTNWLREMRAVWGLPVIEAMGHSWHLIALHRSVFERVGLFTAGYWPGYLEQLDFGYRMRVAGLEHSFARPWINAMSLGHGMHVDRDHWPEVVKVECPYKPLNDLYVARWGGEKGAERWTRPYGDKPIDYDADADTPIPVLAKRYGITDWW